MIKPLGYKVLIKQEEIKETTSGGIVIPDELRDRMKRAWKRGTLMAKGPDVAYGLQNVAIGAKVWYKKFTGDEVWFGDNENDKYLVLNDEDVTAIEGEDEE